MLANGGCPASYQRCATAPVLASNPAQVASEANELGRVPVTPNAEIKRACAGVENQRRIQQIGVIKQVAALDHVEKCHE